MKEAYLRLFFNDSIECRTECIAYFVSYVFERHFFRVFCLHPAREEWSEKVEICTANRWKETQRIVDVMTFGKVSRWRSYLDLERET